MHYTESGADVLQTCTLLCQDFMYQGGVVVVGGVRGERKGVPLAAPGLNPRHAHFTAGDLCIVWLVNAICYCAVWASPCCAFLCCCGVAGSDITLGAGVSNLLGLHSLGN